MENKFRELSRNKSFGDFCFSRMIEVDEKFEANCFGPRNEEYLTREERLAALLPFER